MKSRAKTTTWKELILKRIDSSFLTSDKSAQYFHSPLKLDMSLVALETITQDASTPAPDRIIGFGQS
jgi:hypothetical protein